MNKRVKPMTASLKAYIDLIRPYQWLKNLLLFAPLFFSGSTDLHSVLKVTGASFCFCLASSLGYILNDWMDRETDRNHEGKCTRPFCSGQVSGARGFILFIAIFIGLASCLLLLKLPAAFLIYLVLYLVLTGAYSLLLKQIAVLELFVVSFGFVLRVLAGGAVCDIEISDWLFLTIFFMSMLISVTKRRVEFDLLSHKAHKHRESLKEYNSIYLYNYLWTLGGITLVLYSLYTVEKGNGLVYSVVPAAYGIIRFILLTDRGVGGDPIKALFEDVQLLATTVIFIGYIGLKIYMG